MLYKFFYRVFLAALLAVSACGEYKQHSGDDSNTMGSLSLVLKWSTGEKSANGMAWEANSFAPQINCSALGVDKIVAAVGSGDYSPLLGEGFGGPWSCADGQGSMTVRTGNSLNLLVQGLDSNGNVRYLGTVGATIDIAAGSANHASVQMAPLARWVSPLSSASTGYMGSYAVGSTTVTAIPGHSQIQIAWSAVAGATGYHVYLSRTSPVPMSSSTMLIQNTKGTSYTAMNLTTGFTYYIMVTAVYDTIGGTPSAEVSATAQ